MKNFKNLIFTYRDNIALNDKLKYFESMKKDYDVLRQENQRLLEILDFRKSFKQQLIHCGVIGRTVDDWYRCIIIDKGDRDGVKIGIYRTG